MNKVCKLLSQNMKEEWIDWKAEENKEICGWVNFSKWEKGTETFKKCKEGVK